MVMVVVVVAVVVVMVIVVVVEDERTWSCRMGVDEVKTRERKMRMKVNGGG